MTKVDCPSCGGTGRFMIPQTCLECNGGKKMTKKNAERIKKWLKQWEN